MSNPYHRVRYLSGPQYKESCLREAGVFIQLCPAARGTDLCPGYDAHTYSLPADFDQRAPPAQGGPQAPDDSKPAAEPAGGPAARRARPTGLDVNQPAAPVEDPDDRVWIDVARELEMDEGDAEGQLEDAEDGEEAAEQVPEGTARKRGRAATVQKDHWGYRVMVVVDKADVHQIGVAFCDCAAGGKGMSHDEQLIKLGGLFPATPSNPRTCFTVRGLAYHQVDRLECKVVPQAIMRKLRRFTSPLHPATVPVSS